DIGNRHVVIFCEEAGRELACRLGPALQAGESWDGINVHVVQGLVLETRARAMTAQLFAKLSEEGLKAWTWERGAGETQACGSGACAIGAVALAREDFSRAAWLCVEMPGGQLFVRQEQEGDTVILAGPGKFVFEGWL